MHHGHVYLRFIFFLSKDQKEANLIDRYMKQGCTLKQIIFLLLTFLSCSMQHLIFANIGFAL